MALRFRVAAGKAAIWDNATDTLPFDDPVTNISRVKFHSDLDYDAAVDVRTGTANMPARTVLNGNTTVTLFAHGQGGTPYIRGRMTIGGQDIDIVGSVPISVTGEGHARFVSIGADATNVYLTDAYTSANRNWNSGFPVVIALETHAAQSLPWKVWVFDTLL